MAQFLIGGCRKLDEGAVSVDVAHHDPGTEPILLTVVFPQPQRDSTAVAARGGSCVQRESGKVKGQVEPDDGRLLRVAPLPYDALDEVGARQQAQVCVETV